MFIPALCSILALASASGAVPNASPPRNDHTVLILGGGVTGIIAARTLHRKGIDKFLIIEGREELGGRMRSHVFANTTIELGANWVQGTQTGDGPANPIWDLARKHRVKTVVNDYGSMTTYDETGFVDFIDDVDAATDGFESLTGLAGSRVEQNLVDINAKAGFALLNVKPQTAHAQASEYWNFDWEYANSPVQSSLVATSWNNNFTFNTDQGGFSEENRLATDQRGFKALIQEESKEFLRPDQVLLSSIVKTVAYSKSGVTVHLANGTNITADYAICTFSIGVLQNDDVVFKPALPEWKVEAIQSMVMATYTKIFLKFSQKFWFDTEFALYADRQRGRYPVWQSLDHPKFFNDSGIVFVTVTGDGSERVEALTDSEVQAEAMSVLKNMFPNSTIPPPDDFFFYRWHADPLYRGSYSNWPPSFAIEHHENLRATVKERLWFAGEATSLKYFGFLHGAYFEGLGVTEKLVECIRQTRCAGLPHIEQAHNVRPYHIEL
ncbi:hypothetical protein HGRIS_006825 [Hohenbuehelia grisea]|uniref:Amine oxidase domain-containing protein n=1 Tax=Hohenbuehelia grisea TaxID=104357 RepID=A0ABR3JAA4_9AGAR